MNNLKRNHLAVAGVLFAAASVLYAVGFRNEAVGASVLGVIVELAAWIVLAKDRSEGSFPGGKESADQGG